MILAKWIFTWKSNELGEVVRAKARLVARGFRRVKGVDYFETFSPTPASSCVRLLASIACELDLYLCHFDAEQAFVQENVFMRLPQGCGDLSGKVGIVRYGLSRLRVRGMGI